MVKLLARADILAVRRSGATNDHDEKEFAILTFEESDQFLGGLRRKLLREEVTTRHGVSFHILAP